jgi:hypothetical protein
LIDRIKSVKQNYKWVIYRLCFENYQNKNEIINTETVDQIILDSDALFQVEWCCTGYHDYAVYSNAIPILHTTFVLHRSWIAGLAANTTSVC